MERRLRQTFVKDAKWGPRPITEIATDDIKRIIRQSVKARLFNWAIGTDDYGSQINPCDRLNARDVIGLRQARERVLTDDEVTALWNATDRFDYPYGSLYRLLLLTGVRLGEACGARWSELDIARKEWTIPASRMKKTKDGAKPFIVPLTDPVLDLLSALPRFNSGDALFSNDYGKTCLRVANFSDPKQKLDILMLDELRKKAADHSHDMVSITLTDFVNHDIRRTVRTHLSALRVSEEVREAVLAHVRPGIKGVYDKYQYLEEKREALMLWNARLLSIVKPSPALAASLTASA
jgi:integrase